MKLIVDTNVWISFLISPNLEWLESHLESGTVTLLFSDKSLSEVVTVAQRPKLRKYFSSKQLKALISLFDTYGTMISVSSKLDICRDSDDNFLLKLAVDGDADFLVSGDKDLLVIGRVEKCQIITPAELKKKLQAKSF